MKPLATFIMRGYSQAALVAAGFAILSLLLPFLGLLSSAAVGLFTLREGVRQGVLVIGLAALGAGVLSALALGSPWPALGILIVLWLPVWGLATLLRLSRSLDTTIQVAGGAGLVMVVTIYLLTGDPGVYWAQLLEPLRQTFVNEGAVDASTSEALFGELAKWMTGAFSAALLFQVLLGLMIARWWQAALYNPGGFGDEFRAFRLSQAVGIFSLLLIIWLGFTKEAGLLADLVMVLGVLLLLQGLAVAHAVSRTIGAHRGWLFSLYLLLVLFMPHMELLVACFGLVDIWANIRARVAQRTLGKD